MKRIAVIITAVMLAACVARAQTPQRPPNHVVGT